MKGLGHMFLSAFDPENSKMSFAPANFMGKSGSQGWPMEEKWVLSEHFGCVSQTPIQSNDWHAVVCVQDPGSAKEEEKMDPPT